MLARPDGGDYNPARAPTRGRARENDVFWQRIKYLCAKARRAWSDGTLAEKARRFVAASVRIPCAVTLAYLKLPRADRRLDVAGGFADHRGQAGHCRSNPEHLRRVIAAYKAAKHAQARAPAPFEIRGLWAEWIDVNYRQLVDALNDADEAGLAALLENLQREPFTRGAGGGCDDWTRYRTALTGRFYVRSVWCRYRDLYRALGGPLDDVRCPLVGNPAGIARGGDVIQIQTFRHAYHALEMQQWLRGVPEAVVVEIGGGIGGQAQQLMRRTDTTVSKYVVFDIPEVASVCAYFLLTAFPDKRIRLFGEGPVSVAASEDYDLAVFPHFEVARLPERRVDLFHNACSFAEMDAAASGAYLRIIERTCRRYFSHINHDVRFTYHNADGSTSTNRLGSELVPDPARFKRLFKKPRVFCLPEDRPFPAYEYLYERLPDPPDQP